MALDQVMAEAIALMTTLWALVLAEPRWLVIAGLALDAIGAVLVAWTAWLRVKLSSTYLSETETDQTLKSRRWAVGVGASLLVAGFVLQGVAAWMQMGQGHPGHWTI